jgi:hypothetical protein
MGGGIGQCIQSNESSSINSFSTNLDEVEGGGAGGDAPGGEGSDVGWLDAAGGEEAGEGGARRRESHRRR